MSEKLEKKGKALYRKFLAVFSLSVILFIIIIAGNIATVYTIYGEEKIMNSLIIFTPALGFFAIALVGISTANILWFKKQIIFPLSVIENAIETIRRENYEKKIRLKTGDEFQKIADAFNLLTDKLNILIQTEEEKKEMQNNIIKFLQLMTSVSGGDLTTRAEDTPDVFGSLAGAFNLLTDKIRELVSEVKNSAGEIEQKSHITGEMIQRLQNGAEIQKEEIEKISSLAGEISEIAAQTNEKISTAVDISKKSMDAILRGNEVVTETVKIMELIKTAVQNINSRMKILSEKLREIETISGIINEVANRLDLLALNASLEAARAGEEGRGFVVIAEEIKTLSEKTVRASKNIDNIITSIHEEAKAVTKHLEEGTNYLETATETVSQTVSAFDSIDSTGKRTEQIIEEINETFQKLKEIIPAKAVSAQTLKSHCEDLSRIANEILDISRLFSDTSKKLMDATEGFKI